MCLKGQGPSDSIPTIFHLLIQLASSSSLTPIFETLSNKTLCLHSDGNLFKSTLCSFYVANSFKQHFAFGINANFSARLSHTGCILGKADAEMGRHAKDFLGSDTGKRKRGREQVWASLTVTQT